MKCMNWNSGIFIEVNNWVQMKRLTTTHPPTQRGSPTYWDVTLASEAVSSLALFERYTLMKK